MQWNSEVDLARVAEHRVHEKSNVSTVLVSIGCLQTQSGTHAHPGKASPALTHTACSRERDRLKLTRVAPNLTTWRRRMPEVFVYSPLAWYVLRA